MLCLSPCSALSCMADKQRVKDFQAFVSKVIGTSIENFDPEELLQTEEYLADALQGQCSTLHDEVDPDYWERRCTVMQERLMQTSNKRDRLAMTPPLIAKEINAARSCERTINQCCIVLVEGIDALNQEYASVLDELESLLADVQVLGKSAPTADEKASVESFLNLHDDLLQELCKYDQRDPSRPHELHACGDAHLHEVERLGRALELCEEQRFHATLAIRSVEAADHMLSQQLELLTGPAGYTPPSRAEERLLDQQAQLLELQRDAAAFAERSVWPTIRQLRAHQGEEVLRGDCAFRMAHARAALAGLGRLCEHVEGQHARLELLEADLVRAFFQRH